MQERGGDKETPSYSLPSSFHLGRYSSSRSWCLADDAGRRQQQALEWSERYTIIRGIARGLLYLHEESRLRIIHRDLTLQ